MGRPFPKKGGSKTQSSCRNAVLLPNGSLKKERRCKDRQKIGIIKVTSPLSR